VELSAKRVMVIEDDIANLAIMSVALRQAGAVVQFERWGTETCKKLEEFMPVDVILLDLMFPANVSGYDVFNEIRAVPEFAHIPIVAVTAADPDKEMNRVRQHGFEGFIAKPIRGWSFGKLVKEIIDGKSVWVGSRDYA
jgi:CheY-like chemotaxis protein